ncbi:protein of unknown function (plasmid) [Cupriavidus taiwanensis]|nr:protein of unknown function [Cupriavidus taiwanensis]SPA03562.1 protein of unknown function [Cupriavidus taiwanensis]SPA11461.1 protein of unknown function [Cupriavidus taiwanensis]SPA57369.1 protein of unknown function [Cupriavidus taiwanensis]
MALSTYGCDRVRGANPDSRLNYQPWPSRGCRIFSCYWWICPARVGEHYVVQPRLGECGGGSGARRFRALARLSDKGFSLKKSTPEILGAFILEEVSKIQQLVKTNENCREMYWRLLSR